MPIHFRLRPKTSKKGTKKKRDYEKETNFEEEVQPIEPTKSTHDGSDVRFWKNLFIQGRQRPVQNMSMSMNPIQHYMR